MKYELSLINSVFCSDSSAGGHSGVIPGSSRDHSGVIPGSFQGHSGVIPGSSWDHSGINLGDFGVIAGSLRDHFGVVGIRTLEIKQSQQVALVLAIQSLDFRLPICGL